MKLFVVRHGETDLNTRELACGVSEAFLTEKGRMQAQDLADRLSKDREKNNITALYVSPLKRAKDTASYIERALGLEAVQDDRLHEIDFGEFEGKSWRNPEFLYIHQNPFLRFPSGESFAEAVHRAYSLIDEVRQKHAPHENILFVCHGILTTAIITYFRSLSQDELMHLEVKNCQLLEFDLGSLPPK